MKFARITLMALGLLGGTTAVASAQPYGGPAVVVAPPGWVGPHYYWHRRHFHNRVWVRDHFHRGYWRYY